MALLRLDELDSRRTFEDVVWISIALAEDRKLVYK